MELKFDGHLIYTRNGRHKQTVNVCPEQKEKSQSNCVSIVEFAPPFVTPEEIRAQATATVGDLIEWLTRIRGGHERRRELRGPMTSAPSKKLALTPSSSPIIDPDYLPFSIDLLRNHFAPSSGDDRDADGDRHLRYYLASAQRYGESCVRHGDRMGLPISLLRKPCQIEKDERFWIATCLMSYFYSEDRIESLSKLLKSCFGDAPCIGKFAEWKEALGRAEDLFLFFEVNLQSPPSYKRWLRENLQVRQFIPYVRDAAHRPDGSLREHLEGPTHVDALLLNRENGFSVLFEAKVLSDVSCKVEFDCMRNQIARCVDVMLESNSGLAEPLNRRNPDLTLFALVTPGVFKEQRFRHTRLYGGLMDRYGAHPESLSDDLPHRAGKDWSGFEKRLGWISWETCNKILPDSCPWIEVEVA